MRREGEKQRQRREVESEQMEKGESKSRGREAKTERREAVSGHRGWGERHIARKYRQRRERVRRDVEKLRQRREVESEGMYWNAFFGCRLFWFHSPSPGSTC